MNRFHPWRVRLVIVIIVIAAFAVHSSAVDLSVEMKSQAEKMVEALVTQQYEKFVAYTLPAVVDGVGGKEQMIKKLQTETTKMVHEGYRLNSVTLASSPDMFEAQGHLYGLLVETITMRAPGGTLTKESFLIGVSYDQGSTWSFVEGENFKEDTLKTVFPELVGKFVLPTQKEPTYVPDGSR